MGEPQNQNTLKSSNRARLLERIRRQSTARAELARQLGLTDKLLKVGWAGLSAAESGRIGGMVSAQRKKRRRT